MATEDKLSSSIAFNTMRTTVGSWETQVLPTSQRAPAMGAAAARYGSPPRTRCGCPLSARAAQMPYAHCFLLPRGSLWKSNPANAMTLPTVVAAADADGDGTIDVAEFKVLLEQSGGKTASVEQLFSQVGHDLSPPLLCLASLLGPWPLCSRGLGLAPSASPRDRPWLMRADRQGWRRRAHNRGAINAPRRQPQVQGAQYVAETPSIHITLSSDTRARAERERRAAGCELGLVDGA